MLLTTAKSVALSATRQGITLCKESVLVYVLDTFEPEGLVQEYSSSLSFDALGHWLETVLLTQEHIQGIINNAER